MSHCANPDANANVDPKVLQYENFINEVLKRDLQKVLEQRDSVYEKISQYLQLKNTIQSLQESGSQQLKTDVDLGCNFYVQAEVEDASRIFVAVGYGFFVEMNHDEALRFIDKKTSQLTAAANPRLGKDKSQHPDGAGGSAGASGTVGPAGEQMRSFLQLLDDGLVLWRRVNVQLRRIRRLTQLKL